MEESQQESPYDEFGNVRKSHFEEDDTDRLKIIKARLRKDFHQKVLSESKVSVHYEKSISDTFRGLDPV
jgi:hypothetical protein